MIESMERLKILNSDPDPASNTEKAPPRAIDGNAMTKFPKRTARRSERTGEPQRDALSQYHAITKAVACGIEALDHLGFTLLGTPSPNKPIDAAAN
jgi:hypothetical protein